MDLRMIVVAERSLPSTLPPARTVMAHLPAGATAVDVADLLAAPAGIYVGGRLVPADTPAGLPPLLDGVEVHLAPPVLGDAHSPVATPILEVHVTSGPDAGGIFALGPGRHRVGRAAEAELRIADPQVSRVHLTIDADASGVRVRDLGSGNGTTIDGRDNGRAERRWRVGERLRLGSSVLELRPATGHRAALTYDGAGQALVNRPPRRTDPPPPAQPGAPGPPDRGGRAAARHFSIPAEPETPPRTSVPFLAAVVPLLVAAPLAWLEHSATYLVFGLMSPAMLIGGAVSARVGGRRKHRRARAAWIDQRAAALTEIDHALTAEARARRDEVADCAAMAVAAQLPSDRLWERRPSDTDWLWLRIGSGTRPARLSVADGAAPARSPDVVDVPVVVDLERAGVVGICGERPDALGLARSIVAQLAVWHSPRDLQLVVLTEDSGRRGDWLWASWLPHTRPGSGGRSHSRIGCLSSAEQVTARLEECLVLLDARSSGPVDSYPAVGAITPQVVVLLDGAQALRAVPGMSRLLRHGPAAGIHAICLDTDHQRLPVECQAVVQITPASTRVEGCVDSTSARETADVLVDQVSRGWVDRLAASLAPLRDGTRDDISADLPDRVRLLDLLPEPLLDRDIAVSALAARWSRRAHAAAGVIGMSADGPVVLDLGRDGPHALVGGTTGSGKSELLQTLIATLAWSNPPDQLSFVLVDYKGGAAFDRCADLPHTLGVVTDLDPHLADRALTSLRAELTRRERLLRSAGAKDLDELLARYAGRRPPLARLVLVIDEFKMLADELPSFVDGVVRIAALGRSLGVHLVLATQRPAGIVSADIAANVNLRIALRVRDQVDSEDVIESPLAASITAATPGRAYVKKGPQLLVQFQTAHVGGGPLAGGAGVGGSTPAGWAEPLTWDALAGPPTAPPVASDPSASTDLAVLVDICQAAALRTGLTPPARPWLPPLPGRLLLPDLGVDAERRHAAYAVVDRPHEQSQLAVGWPIQGSAHLAFVGTARSGRTTALCTLAAALAATFSPDELHLHALDGGTGGLAALAALPHVGAVVPRADHGRALRLLERLRDEVHMRQNRLVADGFGSIAELNASALDAAARPTLPTLPQIAVLVDGWEGLASDWEQVDHGAPIELVHGLLRDGPAVGVRLVLTGGRALLVSRMSSLITDTIVLRLADPMDLVMCGISPASVPAHQPPGRGIRLADQAEIQIASLSTDGTSGGQRAAFDLLADDLRMRWPAASRSGLPPFRLEPLPALVTLSSLTAVEQPPAPGPVTLVGVGGDALAPLGLDLIGTCATIVGPAGSGRSTALATLANRLRAAGRPVIDLPGGTGGGVESAVRLRGALDHDPQTCVLVDDAELLLDTEVDDVLAHWLKSPRRGSGSLVVSGSTVELSALFRGVTVTARRSGLGLILSPASYAEGDLLGVRLPPLARADRRPGRGFLVSDGVATPLQVAI